MEQPTICPWCQTEIVWDEEIGPEEFCPHCENELKGYRTLTLDVDDDDLHRQEPGPESGDEEFAFGSKDTARLAYENMVERIQDEQDEVPECPACRDYMLETGRQRVDASSGFKPTVPKAVGEPILDIPFELVWYVCPSCFQMQNRLSFRDRDDLSRRLSGGDEPGFRLKLL